MMMGLFFAASGLGNKVAGLLGEIGHDAGELKVFFGIFLFSVAGGLLVLVFLKRLKALTHGAESSENSDRNTGNSGKKN
jgi:POT family proton-dependent oligopeptide transporter